MRTLYDCFNAKVKGNRIYCKKGYRLNKQCKDGSIGVEKLYRGSPLVYVECQECLDFGGKR
jgi:hypothetical protein